MQTRQRWWIYDRWCERSRGKPQQPSDLLLDVEAMQQAAQQLLGLHDFTTFMDNKKPAGGRMLQTMILMQMGNFWQIFCTAVHSGIQQTYLA
jgi:tRNA U38,U39,U40 pseudouridine synthase TruA